MLGVFDRVATESANLIRGYQTTLVGIYRQAVEQPAPTTVSVRMDAADRAQQAQFSLLGNLTSKVKETSDSVLADALRASGASLSDASLEQLRGVVTDARNDMISVLMVAMLKDGETANKALRDFALRVDMHMNARRIPYAQAVFAVRAAESGLTFSQIDRGGRKWPTTRYVEASVRGFMVRTYVESYLYALGHSGMDMAKVVYPEPENQAHMHNGLVFSITGQSSVLPAYDSIKGEIWHPNSRALVERA